MTVFIVSFVAGVLTVLAPCILPLLPVILAGAVSETKNRRRPLVIIAALSVSVFAFTLLLKGSTALINVSPSFWSYVSAAILAAFGLTLLFPTAWARLVLKIPGHNRPESWISKGYGKESSVWTDIIVGAGLGPVFTTCSPTFFVILATVLPQSLGMGLIDLAAYVIGLALSLLLIAWIGQRLVDRLEWATDPNGWFRRALGILFIAIALMVASGFDKKIEIDILNSGFFDVTKLEQPIREALEKPRAPAPSAAPGAGRPAGDGATRQSAGGRAPKERDLGRYVEIVKPAGFINSSPFKLADLIGKKVILVDFIDYTCINCQRTFPFMNEWYAKYKDQGLEIVAIHTPEFSFEKEIKNVQMGIDRFGLKFPIVLDNDYATWRAYDNNYWPHKYLINIKGNVVYDHIGEGAYDETEAEIVKLLNDRKDMMGESGLIGMGTSSVAAPPVLAGSPETYFGALRNELFGNGKSFTAGESTFTIPESLRTDMFYLDGRWRIDKEYAETAASEAKLSYIFTATNMYIVAQTPDGRAISARILVDGQPIPASSRGADVDASGTLEIKESRLYHIYSNPSLGRHRIDIIFSKPGVRVFTFTFG